MSVLLTREQCKIPVPQMYPGCTSHLASTLFYRMAPRLRPLRVLSPWCAGLSRRPFGAYSRSASCRGVPRTLPEFLPIPLLPLCLPPATPRLAGSPGASLVFRPGASVRTGGSMCADFIPPENGGRRLPSLLPGLRIRRPECSQVHGFSESLRLHLVLHKRIGVIHQDSSAVIYLCSLFVGRPFFFGKG